MSSVAQLGADLEEGDAMATALMTLLVIALAEATSANVPKYDRPPRPPLTAEESAEPHRSGRELCQPSISFRINDPGSPFHLKPELGGGGGNVRTWAWESGETHERLLITVIKAMAETPEGFKGYMAGGHRGLANEPSVKSIDDDNVDTGKTPYAANLNARLTNGNAYSMRCIGTGDTGRMPWLVCASTVALEHATLRPLRESLSFGPCPNAE